MTQDEKYMQTALKLARRGLGSVEPNPAVGCIIVKDGRVIGRGYHKRFGEAHAEVNAIADCRTRGYDPADGTMYVTLEPCCHTGKTPPCTEAIIDADIAKVVAAVTDPTENIGGEGMRCLRDAGIEVVTGICREQAERLNAPFFKFARTGRPWVILKWAQSIDGKLAWTDDTDRRWISNELSRKDAHRLRTDCQAILVGIGTVLADNPALTPRPPRGNRPMRVVLDSGLRIPLGSRILNTRRFPTMIITTEASAKRHEAKIDRILAKHVDIHVVRQADERCDLDDVLAEMGRCDVRQLLVEGGPTLLSAFIEAGLADAVRIYIAPIIMGDRGKSGISQAMSILTKSVGLDCVETSLFGGDVRIHGLIHKD